MPNYDYECDCGNRFEAFADVARRHEMKCSECGSAANLIITSCRRSSFRPYYSRTFNTWIGTEKDKIRLMRDAGYEEYTSVSEVRREAERMERQEDEIEQNKKVPDKFVELCQRLQAQT